MASYRGKVVGGNLNIRPEPNAMHRNGVYNCALPKGWKFIFRLLDILKVTEFFRVMDDNRTEFYCLVYIGCGTCGESASSARRKHSPS